MKYTANYELNTCPVPNEERAGPSYLMQTMSAVDIGLHVKQIHSHCSFY